MDLEDRIPLAVRDGLTQRGHQIILHGAYSATMGGGQAVQRDISTGVNYGASDPRKDGEAIPEPSPQKLGAGRDGRDDSR